MVGAAMESCDNSGSGGIEGSSKAAAAAPLDGDEDIMDGEGEAGRKGGGGGAKGNKLCTVCGDKALGYNFNALTCESCKAFFRRNALKNKEFKCPFSNKCEVTVVTRRFCQRCRLKKCFDIGMKKEWILSDEEKLQKRAKIEENRAKKRTSSQAGISSSSGVASVDCASSSSAVNSPSQGDLERPGSSAEEDEVGAAPMSPQSGVMGPASLLETRPQARVLPSARPASTESSAGLPTASKMARYDSSSNLACSAVNTSPQSYHGPPGGSHLPPLQPQSQPPPPAPQQPNTSASLDSSAPVGSSGFPICLTTTTTPTTNVVVPGSDLAVHAPSSADQQHHVGGPPPPPPYVPNGGQFSLIKQELNSSNPSPQQPDFQPPPPPAPQLEPLVPPLVSNGKGGAMASHYNGSQVPGRQHNPSIQLGMRHHAVPTSSDDMAHSVADSVPMNLEMKYHQPPSAPPPPPQPHQSCTSNGNNANGGDTSHPDGGYLVGSSSSAASSSSVGGSAAAQVLAARLKQESEAAAAMNRPPPPQPSSTMMIPDFSNADNLDDIIAIAIEAEFPQDRARLPNDRSLSERESNRMMELFLASRSLEEPLEPTYTAEPNNLISVINLTDLAIKRIIRMAMKITPFVNMCQEDQIALLKGGCTELMILRSVINYDPEKNSWRIPSVHKNRQVSLDILREAIPFGVNLYEEHQRFVKSFDPKWRTDEQVMLLLSAIALFSPDAPNVVHRDVVKLEQETYYYLLQRYLDTACPTGCESRRAYLHLIGRLQDLHRLNQSHIQLLVALNPKQVEPLLIEIFDLNPKGEVRT